MKNLLILVLLFKNFSLLSMEYPSTQIPIFSDQNYGENNSEEMGYYNVLPVAMYTEAEVVAMLRAKDFTINLLQQENERLRSENFEVHARSASALMHEEQIFDIPLNAREKIKIRSKCLGGIIKNFLVQRNNRSIELLGQTNDKVTLLLNMPPLTGLIIENKIQGSVDLYVAPS